ncbi:hypothetical protein BaRGS_00037954, partial [Batillaria attramentaria]
YRRLRPQPGILFRVLTTSSATFNVDRFLVFVMTCSGKSSVQGPVSAQYQVLQKVPEAIPHKRTVGQRTGLKVVMTSLAMD